MNAPLISVIVPVHDVAGYIGRCLDSLRAQSLGDFEAIVIDDGARDESLAEATAAAVGDRRFRFFATPNAGLSAARNLGLDMARGEFIAFLDGDDRYAPAFLERMHAALAGSEADWVACGLRYMPVGQDEHGGPVHLHSAIHAAPELAPAPGGAAPRLHDLSDWREVVGHFPSAWNKLYRRKLIEGLRFDEGLAFEDHAFYWQVAARTRSLLHLPEPLYLQTVARAGQITGDGGERVFEQFAVLERLHGLLAGLEGRAGREEAFRGLATRLLFERGAVIADRQRRVRFVAESEAFFARHGIDWQKDGAALKLGRFGRALLGRRLLSVVVPSDGKPGPLRESLESLAAQTFADFDVLVVSDGQARSSQLARVAEAAGMGRRASIIAAEDGEEATALSPSVRVARARNRGLDWARGDFVVLLDAGDRLFPGALAYWLDAMMGAGGREGADMGFSGFRIGAEDGAAHGGVHGIEGLEGFVTGRMTDEAAVMLHPLPSAKIYRRAFLEAEGLRFGEGPWQAWGFAIAAARRADWVFRLDGFGAIRGEGPERRAFWEAPVSAEELVAALDALAAGFDPVLGQRLLARAIWEKLNFAEFRGTEAREAFRREAFAAWRERQAGLPGAAEIFDPYMAEGFRSALAGKGMPG